jgi:ribosomal protein S19
VLRALGSGAGSGRLGSGMLGALRRVGGQSPPFPLEGPRGKPVEAHRGAIINMEMVGKTFFVHNGKDFRRIKPSTLMVGHKFGEFARTKLTPKHKVKKQQQVRGKK